MAQNEMKAKAGLPERVRLNEGLDRCIAECTKDRIYAGLIPRPLGLEPLKHILIDSKGDRGFGRQRMQATTDNTSDDVIHIGFGMLGGGHSRLGGGTKASPVSAGLH